MLGLSARALREVDQELKEAVCKALVNLAVARVSASDAEGEMVFGPSPNRSIVSGLLLPRFDPANQADESSDIRIAAMGIDFQLDAGADDELEATPRFSVYVRVLPTWDDLDDEARGLDIEFDLLPAIRQALELRVRQLRDAAFAREGVATPAWPTLTPDQKTDVRNTRARLQREALVEAYGEQNIHLEGSEEEIDDRPADPDDEEGGAPPEAGDDGQPARIRVGRLLQRGRDIPVNLLSPAKPPAKWKRIALLLKPFRWRARSTTDDLLGSLAAHAAQMRQEATDQVTAWLNSEEGQRIAWRDLRVLPQECGSEAAWGAFLARAAQTPIPLPRVLPRLDNLSLEIDRTPDFTDLSRASIRVAIDNGSPALRARDAQTRTDSVFNVSLNVRLPKNIHRPLRLDRVEPSYRFRDFMDYAAIGLNCGVTQKEDGCDLVLATTWAPSFVQPRILPRELEMPVTFGAFADPEFDVAALKALPRAYGAWIDGEAERLKDAVREGLIEEDADRETQRLRQDQAAQRKEVEYISRGIEVLERSQAAARALSGEMDAARRQELTGLAAPYRAWRLTNEAFFNRDGKDVGRGWRLFQIAFILAHVPTLASRMDAFRTYQDLGFDEESASLLYFPTGGGKSEAFYGALLFAMFLDRLRGKDRGVTALIRYPLRLLTLQQGQRLLRLIAHAELVRRDAKTGSWPFEIGFWVGGANTPNRYKQTIGDVPHLGELADDTTLEKDVRGRTAEDEKAAERYRDFRAAYNKVPQCPICGSDTGLRRFEADGRTAYRLAIVCFDPSCPYNDAHGGLTPLPFLLNDDTIYARAPAVVLGTIDKLAMLGQHTTTIRQVLGMFGMARGIGPTGHLYSPRVEGDIAAVLQENDYAPVFPSFRGGAHVFNDPFPSLIIQDEAHLLEESLGTFSGLFDTLLESCFKRIDEIAGPDLHVARMWTGDGYGAPRMPKVIAATATISNPERQLDVLYQRRPLRFPYPGSDIYRSFFSSPAPAPASNPARVAKEAGLLPSDGPEATAPWMRLFVAMMTNGATHTVTAVAVLSAFHLVVSRLWRALLDDSARDEAIQTLRAAQGEGEEAEWRRAAIDRAVADDRVQEIVALIDLHRISLAYVTNKKGGDQVIDALDVAVQQRHRLAHLPSAPFTSRLISGGIEMKEIQEVMALAEEANPGAPYPPIDERIRSIVATSAISHGVDVDRFNSMFFAGLPSDIAEYIQASSRVGRTHVGFVMLVPTPQSRRDRYVVETFDIFHRFLERMIAPPAVERWAENAIRRVLASIIQAWAVLEENAAFVAAPDTRKARLASFEVTTPLATRAKQDLTGLVNEVGEFVLRGIGFEGRGATQQGRPVYQDIYRALVERELTSFGRSLRTLEGALRLQEYWRDASAVMKPPMTSLRDVDEAGLITAGAYDALARARTVAPDDLIHVMRVIRQQRGAVAELDAELPVRGGS